VASLKISVKMGKKMDLNKRKRTCLRLLKKFEEQSRTFEGNIYIQATDVFFLSHNLSAQLN